MKLRVIVGENYLRGLDLPSELPKTVTELQNIVCQELNIYQYFHIQFMYPDFNYELMNFTSVQDLKDRSTVKLVFMSASGCSLQQNPSSSGSSESIQRNSSVSSLSSSDSESPIILEHSDSELRTRPWPRKCIIPQFPHIVEIQFQPGNETFKAAGTTLKITPGLKSDILEKLA